MTVFQREVGINDAGLAVGEDHPKAKLTDAEVELVRQLHEEGVKYREIAVIMEISRHSVGRICRYERRNQIATRTKIVHMPDYERS